MSKKTYKYFDGLLEIRNGEFEYEYPKCIKAQNEKEAFEKLDEYAKGFYGGESDKQDDAYFFHGGEVAVTPIIGSTAYDTKEDWFRAIEFRFSLGGSIDG